MLGLVELLLVRLLRDTTEFSDTFLFRFFFLAGLRQSGGAGERLTSLLRSKVANCTLCWAGAGAV